MWVWIIIAFIGGVFVLGVLLTRQYKKNKNNTAPPDRLPGINLTNPVYDASNTYTEGDTDTEGASHESNTDTPQVETVYKYDNRSGRSGPGVGLENANYDSGNAHSPTVGANHNESMGNTAAVNTNPPMSTLAPDEHGELVQYGTLTPAPSGIASSHSGYKSSRGVAPNEDSAHLYEEADAIGGPVSERYGVATPFTAPTNPDKARHIADRDAPYSM